MAVGFAAGFTIGRPLESIPVAHVIDAYGVAEISFPFSRSIT
jgi:hypothetical protein